MDAKKYGPWAVIPGGSEGIGAQIAHRLAKDGLNIVLVARKQGPMDELAAKLQAEHKVKVRTLSLDLTAADMLDKIRKVTDDIDVGLLVYNAGAAHKTTAFLDSSLDDALRIIRVNVVGQATLCYHFGTRLAQRGRGGIIIIGSMAGNAGSPSVVTYGGAKAFSQIFAEGLWWELKQRGVEVLHMVVGPTTTPAMARMGIFYHEGEAVEADEVARLSLENIANGPVFVMPELAAGFRAFATIDRRGATEANAAYVLGNTPGGEAQRK
jgi:hypothetical protein